jgi:hypothetical protein
MSEIGYIADHVTRAWGFVVSQFSRARNLRALVEALAQEVQIAEDALQDLIYGLRLDSATDAQLDLLGSLFGEPREGLPDLIYRRFIGARLVIRLSQGTPDTVTTVASRLIGVPVEYRPAYPAGYRLQYTLPVPLDPNLRARILARIIEATPAGVGVELIESTTPTPFTFGVSGLGFNQGNLTQAYT